MLSSNHIAKYRYNCLISQAQNWDASQFRVQRCW